MILGVKNSDTEFSGALPPDPRDILEQAKAEARSLHDEGFDL